MKVQLTIIFSLLSACVIYAQERDPRVRTYITPTRIVWQQDSDHITNCKFLLNQGMVRLIGERITITNQ